MAPEIHVGVAQDLKQVGLVGLFQVRLKLVGVVEIVLKRALAARGDKDELLDAGGTGLVDRILDQRLVHQGHDFLGNTFRGGKETGHKACHGKNGLGYFAAHQLGLLTSASTFGGLSPFVCNCAASAQSAKPFRLNSERFSFLSLSPPFSA